MHKGDLEQIWHDKKQKSFLQLTNLLSKFALQNRLARASELALLGAFASAEAVLMPRGFLPKSHQELDLLARIKVQLGELDSARELWVAAGKASTRSYADEITELEGWKIAIGTRKKMILRYCTLAVALASIVAIGVWIIPIVDKATKKPEQQTAVMASPTPKAEPSASPSLTATATPTPKLTSSPSKDHKKNKRNSIKPDSD